MSRVEDLRAYLRSLDIETLADLLHEQAERDPELASRLRVRAGAARGDLGEVHSLLDGALPARDRRAEGAGNGEAAKIGAVLDTLQRMLDAGSQADLAPLARRTVDRITAAIERTVDPSEEDIAELRRAVKLYARACAAHRHQPEQLADWILAAEFDHGRPRIELADFAGALGKPGLERIKSTVDSVLDGPAEADPVRRRTAERLAEQLAEISGDVDALVEILSKRLPPLEVSLRIVRALRAAGRTTEAIAHAAKALAQGSGPARGPVVDALVETFESLSANRGIAGCGDRLNAPSEGSRARSPIATEETGRRDEALTLRRAEFERSPALPTYLALREVATELRRWDTEREAALRLLGERAREDAPVAGEFVRVLLAEERPEEAWQAALRHECSLPVKLELAECTETEHPAEAIAVYRQQVTELIERRDPDHYRQAAQRLRKLRTLYRTAGRAPEFADYLAELVRLHGRKARLLAEIRNARIALPRTRSSR